MIYISKNGFDNETQILEALDGKRVCDLNKNLTEFLKFLCSGSCSEEDIIMCRKEGGANKSDLIVRIGSRRPVRVSVKKGRANSVHQEPLDEFIAYIRKEFNASEQLCNDIRGFIWGNGTLNGTGEKEDREGVSELKRSMPNSIRRIRIFLKEHKRNLVERFLVVGLKSSRTPDIIYYGDPNDGLWAWFDEVLDFLCHERNEARRAALPVGGLTLQAWGRANSEGSGSDRNRGVVQSKWPSLKNHLKEIMHNKSS